MICNRVGKKIESESKMDSVPVTGQNYGSLVFLLDYSVARGEGNYFNGKRRIKQGEC